MLGIIGAGPSGLCARLFYDGEAEILEADRVPGGHAGTFVRDGFVFDYGPHIMFSKDQAVLDFMIKSLGSNVAKCKRHNKISFKSRLVKYPFENDLGSLPKEDAFNCLKGFVLNPFKEQFRDPKNLREWFLKTFGEGICEAYLFPYNEKVWNIPVEDLSMQWADRIPNPPPEDIIKSALGIESEGYLHQLYYHYPRRGGYQAISEAWTLGATIHYQHRVERIEVKPDKTFVVTACGKDRHYSKLISTMPIQDLVRVLQAKIPHEVQIAIDSLVVNPMYVVSLAIRGVDQNKFTAIYFPEKDFLVNRVSYPGTFSELNCPAGTHSIQAEITCRADAAEWSWSDDQIIDHTISGLVQRQIIENRDRVMFADVRRRKYSYVVYDRNYERNTKIIRDYFDSLGLTLLGRFSYFEYVNVDGAVNRAVEVVQRLNESDLIKNQLLDRALERINCSQ
jgi:protoporphyrinogen oxidase